ncbi:MAG: SLC13 family permease [Brevinematales bacterium]|jgi:Na+/H+ antiporter NhaD/arsenite permease-like protein
MLKNITGFIKKESVFFVFFGLLILLLIIFPSLIPQYPGYIDWNTMITLTGLIIVTTGLKESGYFDKIAAMMLVRIHSERAIALFLIVLSALLSAFITNDIALFIIVPLTVSLLKGLQNDLNRLVIFEAIAVNAGSALTPIGNPQNLYLWHIWGIPFHDFILKMMPLTSILIILLTVFTLISFGNEKLVIEKSEIIPKDKNLFIFSFLMMAVFIVFLELRMEAIPFMLIVFTYLIFFRKTLLKMDFFLLMLFMVMFIDFTVLSKASFVRGWFHILPLDKSGSLFLISAFLSQGASNVPAAIFLSKFSNNYQAIAYGVNVGGQGFIIGSLANLIALRLLKNKKAYFEFHKYSIPFFLISLIVSYLLFFFKII